MGGMHDALYTHSYESEPVSTLQKTLLRVFRNPRGELADSNQMCTRILEATPPNIGGF